LFLLLLLLLTTPWSRILLQRLIIIQLVQEFPAFYVTQRFITVFTATRPYPEPDESSPQLSPTLFSKIHSKIISSHLLIGLPSSHFRPGLPIKILYAFIISPMRATCHAHLNLDLITLMIFGKWCML